ncbi:carboxymuconolactone decarboxylase family protein [Falsiroseomonas sp. HW251]|uniref:carboxymuconolactone decarboxylase family protein n=1 Tax=Falsiroseomonas sp. HW251 TaxID=3390998 RepID=UPI003D3158A2
MTGREDEPDPEALMAEYIRNRGDIFEEWHFMARYVPRTVMLQHDASGYILQNANKTTPDQELSVVMRELIATAYLSAKGDQRFAANHVRRLYRLGVTSAVIFEAAEAIAPVVGHSTISHVARSIMLANDPAYPFGVMPPGGEPKQLTPFPELDIGREASEPPSSIAKDEDWRDMAAIDPELARRTAAFVDHCLAIGRKPTPLLGPGPRALVAIAALCARGEAEIAARYIRRAYACGISRRKVLEAISVVYNMTGAVSVQIGIRAIRLAEATGSLPQA